MDTNSTISITAFIVLTLLWLIFLAALLINRQLLADAWGSFRRWNIVLQIIIGLLFLPVVLGLWIWNTRWPVLLRLILDLALAWVTIYTFFPKLPVS